MDQNENGGFTIDDHQFSHHTFHSVEAKVGLLSGGWTLDLNLEAIGS